MGKQSSRIYIPGLNQNHKEIYLNGRYHNKMYIGSELVWEKYIRSIPSMNIIGSAVLDEYFVVEHYSNERFYILYKGNLTEGFVTQLSLPEFNINLLDEEDLTYIEHSDYYRAGCYDKETNSVYLFFILEGYFEEAASLDLYKNAFFLIRKINLYTNTVEDYYSSKLNSKKIDGHNDTENSYGITYLGKDDDSIYSAVTATEIYDGSFIIKFDLELKKFTRYNHNVKSPDLYFYGTNGRQYRMLNSDFDKVGVGASRKTAFGKAQYVKKTATTEHYYVEIAMLKFESCEAYVNAILNREYTDNDLFISGGEFEIITTFEQSKNVSSTWSLMTTENYAYYRPGSYYSIDGTYPIYGYDFLLEESFDANGILYNSELSFASYPQILMDDICLATSDEKYVCISKQDTIGYFNIADGMRSHYIKNPFYEKNTDAIYVFYESKDNLFKIDFDNNTLTEVT